MSTFSDEMAAVAVELISEFGQAGEFVRVTQGIYDPTNGESFSETDTAYMGMIVPNDYKESEIDGTIIQRGDIQIYAHAMEDTPQVGDLVTFGSVDYRILDVKKTKANGADCLYTMQVRV